MKAALEQLLQSEFGTKFRIEKMTPVAGGDSNRAIRVDATDRVLFAKMRPCEGRAMFEAEAEGLHALSRCTSVRVPAVIALAEIETMAVLVLEWLDMSPLSRKEDSVRAGRALADLHRITGQRHGWEHDNFIGLGPQINGWADDWGEFFIHCRLEPQFARTDDPILKRHGEWICANASRLFGDYRPVPSLLHGDLWSGNIGVLASGEIALFDPACAYGDREADLAMTKLFGGFPPAFYTAYENAWPLDGGAERRRDFYNLYHILNHYTLFGDGYLRQARHMAEQVIAQVGS